MQKNINIRDLKILHNLTLTNSLSTTAQHMGIAQANISKALAIFEEKMGLKIFDRTVRPIKLTSFGVELLPHLINHLNTYDELNSFIDHSKNKASGIVEINAPSGQLFFLSRYVLPALKLTHPEIHVRLVTTNLERSEYLNGAKFNQTCDILFTHTRPSNVDLVARKISNMSANVYTTPEMLKKHPVCDVSSYSKIPSIVFLSFMNSESNIWSFNNKNNGENINVAIRGNYICDNALTALELAKAELGYVYMPDYIVKEMGYDRFLVPTLPEKYTSGIEIFMIYKKRAEQPYRVSLLIQAILDITHKILNRS